MNKDVRTAVIGAGLAGSEAALVLSRFGCSVDLFEMRPEKMTEAHSTERPAELVCSNSLKSCAMPSGHALLKEELKALDSPLLAAAFATAVPAGSALAVDRDNFSAAVAEKIAQASNITLHRTEVTEIPAAYDAVIIATGPLTSPAMTAALQERFSAEEFNFYDAVAPIFDAESIDMNRAFLASRWGKGTADYINCPFTKEEYDRFYDALLEADRVKKRDFEDEHFFESCLPVEVLAQRDYDALRFSMMKPVGLRHPETGESYHAVCQLRMENRNGTAYNMVGFQTRMTFPEQRKVFRMIPGLEQAEFLRYGTIHRNSYLNSPNILRRDLSFKDDPSLFLAGQLTGNEGYTESIATGHVAALSAAARIAGVCLTYPGNTTALGGLLDHIVTVPEKGRFTPTNINFGLLAHPGRKMRKRDRKEFYCTRARTDFDAWRAENASLLK
ncbi:MAG: methylenetetrahydrofolate--tRNA-(uracil(54)-C(5))-methyltransferase (FADH(2)-oxidizing) TrmFO [Fibrobacterota bacterium]